MKKKKASAKWLLVILYILAIAVYLLICFAHWNTMNGAFSSGNITTQTLQLEDFTQVNILPVENDKQGFVSTNSDPQLIYSQEEPFLVDRMTFSASSQKPGGEIVLYYAEDDTYLTQDFDEKNKVWAKQLSDGTWYFDLNGKKVQALRLDPDTAGGVVWQVNDIQLNVQKSMQEYFMPSWIDIFSIVFIPLLLCAIILYTRQIVLGFCAKNKGDEQQKEVVEKSKSNEETEKISAKKTIYKKGSK